MDFMLARYRELVTALIDSGYSFITFSKYMEEKVNSEKSEKLVIMRHDVDRRPDYALNMAEAENELGIRSSYYFRVTANSFNKEIMKSIASYGHEIGYHYEDLTLAKGDQAKAAALFEKHLARFREIYDVSTICMHGSPFSGFDNRDIWKTYNYRDYGIRGEPYFDIDFNDFIYITDTGRKWNNSSVSVRDRVENRDKSEMRNFADSSEIIRDALMGDLSDRIMFNIHSERWTDSKLFWLQQLLWQNFKNIVKRVIIRRGKI